MRTIKYLRDYLLENYVDDDGDLNITGLDFSDFDGDIYIVDMKVKRDLYQSEQEVQGDLTQGYQEVKGNYYCSNVRVKGNIFAEEPTKLLTEITLEELAELGYKIKE